MNHEARDMKQEASSANALLLMTHDSCLMTLWGVNA